MRVKIGYQDGSVDDINAQDPWKHVRWSLGLHLLPNGDGLLDNGVGNADRAGKIYIRSLEVDGVPVMAPGSHIIPPRALLPLRRSPLAREPVFVDHLPNLVPKWRSDAESAADKIAAAIVTGKRLVSMGFPFDAMGPWFPAGDPGDSGMQPGAVSGQGIEPLPGWDRSSRFRLQLADHVMHRMPVAYVDVATGDPLPKPKQLVYTLWRGNFKDTSLAEFMTTDPTSSNPDARIARACNAGSCPYEQTMLGANYYAGAIAYDIGHLVRGFRHALAGAQVFDDPLCKLYLKLIAGDVALCWGNMPPLTRHAGATWPGRDCGWALLIMKSVGHPGAAALDRALRQVRLPDSLHQRVAWPGPGKTSNYAPEPWVQGYADHDDQLTQSIEAAIVGYASTEPVAVANALTHEGNPSHFMIVNTGSIPRLDKRANFERESFNVWFVWGKALLGAGRADRNLLLERAKSMRLPDDGTQYNDVPTLLAGMRKNPHTDHLAVAIHALESL